MPVPVPSVDERPSDSPSGVKRRSPSTRTSTPPAGAVSGEAALVLTALRARVARLVRCLSCETVYAQDERHSVAERDGCPNCGYVGWTDEG